MNKLTGYSLEIRDLPWRRVMVCYGLGFSQAQLFRGAFGGFVFLFAFRRS